MKKIEYDIAASSIIGTRKEQQDAYYYEEKNEECLAVICDGMGGLADGARASKIAVDTIKLLYSMKKEESFDVFFMNALDILDESVYEIRKSKKEEIVSGTTIVSVALAKDNMYWFSVGDSRLYLKRGKEMICVTRDHNYFLILNEALKKGEISQDIYNKEKKRGESLISYIGMGGIEMIDINKIPVELCNNDVVLLVSDGIYRYLPYKEIQNIIDKSETSKEMVENLINGSRMNAKKGQDNATVIAIKVIIQEEKKNEVNKM